MGDMLAAEAKRVLQKVGLEIDVVIPVSCTRQPGACQELAIAYHTLMQVPDTSRVAALQLAQNLNIPYREGFVKNRYVGRTFIMPGQTMR